MRTDLSEAEIMATFALIFKMMVEEKSEILRDGMARAGFTARDGRFVFSSDQFTGNTESRVGLAAAAVKEGISIYAAAIKAEEERSSAASSSSSSSPTSPSSSSSSSSSSSPSCADRGSAAPAPAAHVRAAAPPSSADPLPSVVVPPGPSTSELVRIWYRTSVACRGLYNGATGAIGDLVQDKILAKFPNNNYQKLTAVNLLKFIRDNIPEHYRTCVLHLNTSVQAAKLNEQRQNAAAAVVAEFTDKELQAEAARLVASEKKNDELEKRLLAQFEKTASGLYVVPEAARLAYLLSKSKSVGCLAIIAVATAEKLNKAVLEGLAATRRLQATTDLVSALAGVPAHAAGSGDWTQPLQQKFPRTKELQRAINALVKHGKLDKMATQVAKETTVAGLKSPAQKADPPVWREWRIKVNHALDTLFPRGFVPPVAGAQAPAAVHSASSRRMEEDDDDDEGGGGRPAAAERRDEEEASDGEKDASSEGEEGEIDEGAGEDGAGSEQEEPQEDEDGDVHMKRGGQGRRGRTTSRPRPGKGRGEGDGPRGSRKRKSPGRPERAPPRTGDGPPAKRASRRTRTPTFKAAAADTARGE